MLKSHSFMYRCTPFIFKNAQQQEDIRNLPNVKINLFGSQTWNLINSFMNSLNVGLITLGKGQNLAGSPINFQTIVKNPSQVGIFSGSLKNLAQLSLKLWDIVTKNQNQPYTLDQAKIMANDFQNTLNSMSFIEPGALDIKTKINNALTTWSASLS